MTEGEKELGRGMQASKHCETGVRASSHCLPTLRPMQMPLGAGQLRRSINLRSGGHHLRERFVRIDRRGGLDRKRSGQGKARRLAVGVQAKALRDDLAPRTI